MGRQIGTGGEGTVYEIQDRADLVAKIYHEPPSPEKAEKLLALARIGAERLFNLSAWPADVLSDQVPANDGNIVGFVMRRIGQAEEVHALHSPKSRLQKFPEASWAFLIYAAANIARAISVMHEHGFVVGDVNPKNILVTRKATITLLDCDSFQVTAEGKTYRCEGGFPEYTPPELQGVAFRDVERNEHHDCFGLAVVIFQLLFLGRHPFSGRFSGEGEMPLERAIAESRFAYGSDANLRQMQPPPGTLAMTAISKPLVNLFHRAFLSADRPSASEWIEPLETLAKSLKRCAMHSGHHFFAELTECPWCAIEMRARIRLFNFLLPGADQNHGQFRLDEVWKEIDEAALPLALATMPSRIDWGTVQPSEEVKKRFGRTQTRHLAALFLAVAGGLVIGYYGDFCLGTVLLFMAIPVLRKVLDFSAEPPSAFVLSNITGASPPPSADPFIRQIEEAKTKAEATIQQMEEQWRKEASAERVQNGLQNLLAQKEAYQNLPKLREQKLNQLQSKARDTQLEEYLDQFEITDAKISGISSATKASLLSYGIETAADLTPPRLEQVKTMDPAGAKVLRRWQREVAEQFTFNPEKGVSDHARIAVEREMDEMRFRLEHELASGAYYLRRIKLEVEEARQKLTPKVEEASQSLARAEKDYEASQKALSIGPVVLALIISFIIGFGIELIELSHPYNDDSYETNQTYSPPPSSTSTYQEVSQEDAEKALALYNSGRMLLKQNKFEEAANAFQEAISVNPQMEAAREELGYALYRLGKYGEAVEPLRMALQHNPTFEANYYLGLVYIELKNLNYAEYYLLAATPQIPGDRTLTDKEIDAYNRLGYVFKQNEELESNILAKEIAVKESEAAGAGRSEEEREALEATRFELGNLYVWAGKYDAANEQYRQLRVSNRQLAAALKKLMILHVTRTAGRNTGN
ncbi:MAG: tetratricopeptide repeat protein [Acidobacteriota bacterium]